MVLAGRGHKLAEVCTQHGTFRSFVASGWPRVPSTIPANGVVGGDVAFSDGSLFAIARARDFHVSCALRDTSFGDHTGIAGYFRALQSSVESGGACQSGLCGGLTTGHKSGATAHFEHRGRANE